MENINSLKYGDQSSKYGCYQCRVTFWLFHIYTTYLWPCKRRIFFNLSNMSLVGINSFRCLAVCSIYWHLSKWCTTFVRIWGTNENEIRYYRNILGISYLDHVTNEEVCKSEHRPIRLEDLLTTPKKRQLRWYDHITRSTGLAKTILQGTLEGEWGRQQNKWADDDDEWTTKPFWDTQSIGPRRWNVLVNNSSQRRPHDSSQGEAWFIQDDQPTCHVFHLHQKSSGWFRLMLSACWFLTLSRYTDMLLDDDRNTNP